MSVLAKEIKKEYELSKEYIEAGFQHLLKAGELLAEVEELAGAEEVENWLNENCSEVDIGQAIRSLNLFKGEKIQLYAYRTEPEEKKEK